MSIEIGQDSLVLGELRIRRGFSFRTRLILSLARGTDTVIWNNILVTTVRLIASMNIESLKMTNLLLDITTIPSMISTYVIRLGTS